MRLPRTVKIRIDRDGLVEIETDGFVGPACLDVVKALAPAILGGEPDEGAILTAEKPEFLLREEDAWERQDDRRG